MGGISATPTFDPTPKQGGENEKKLRKTAEEGDEGLTDKCQVFSGGFFFSLFFYLTSFYFTDKSEGVCY